VGGACDTHGRGEYRTFWWESPKERNHSEDQGVDGRVGSEWILGRMAGECKVDSVGSGLGPVTGSCEYGDGPSGSGATELVNIDRTSWSNG
jgi:hypothetical protein